MEEHIKYLKILGWQRDYKVHPLTCGNCDEREKILEPISHNKKTVLSCPTCKHIQEDIPEVVLKHRIAYMGG